jgi:hypothetical protein
MVVNNKEKANKCKIMRIHNKLNINNKASQTLQGKVLNNYNN